VFDVFESRRHESRGGARGAARAPALHALGILLLTIAPPTQPPRHSTAIVVVDADGNIAVGMHTLNALPFGEGLFVGGVPLSSALEFERVSPDQSVLEPVSPVIALLGGAPRLALAQLGVGEFAADFAVASAVVDADLDVVDVVDAVAITPGRGAHALRGVPAELLGGRAEGY
jgi:hypothetical protein